VTDQRQLVGQVGDEQRRLRGERVDVEVRLTQQPCRGGVTPCRGREPVDGGERLSAGELGSGGGQHVPTAQQPHHHPVTRAQQDRRGRQHPAVHHVVAAELDQLPQPAVGQPGRIVGRRLQPRHVLGEVSGVAARPGGQADQTVRERQPAAELPGDAARCDRRELLTEELEALFGVAEEARQHDRRVHERHGVGHEVPGRDARVQPVAEHAGGPDRHLALHRAAGPQPLGNHQTGGAGAQHRHRRRGR
jgi:hypothetical protein